MADLGWQDFLTRLGEKETAPSQATATAAVPSEPDLAQEATGTEAALGEAAQEAQAPEPISLLPASEETLRKIGAAATAQRLATPTQVEPSKWDTLAQLGARPGVPFDTASGVPFRVRVAAEKEPTEDEKLASYKIAYGDENVRRNKFGQIIVTMTDEKGKTVDRLANPLGLDASDLATFAASMPEVAGGILPLIATRGATLGPGFWKALGTLGLTTAGAEMGGAAKDMYQRWLRGEGPNVPEVAQRHAVSGTYGLITGGALGAGGFVLGRAVSPFNARGRLQLNAAAGRDLLNERYGTKLALSAAEETGSPILAAGEALESQKPGSRSGFAMFREKVQAEIDKLRKIATGEMTDEEAAGRQVLDKLEDALAPLNFDVESAAQEARKAASEAIRTTIGAPIDKVTVGRAIELGAKARKGVFDLVNQRNYDAFYDNPLARQRIIGGADLKAAVDNMLEELPAVDRTVQVLTGLVNAQNQPIFTQGTRTIPVSTPVRERLEEISAKLANGKISINDLKQIRTDVDNAIKTGEAVPGVKEGRLKHYYSALTDAIESGLKDIGDPTLTGAWKTATGYYKANVDQFEKAGIAELFRDPINAIGPTEMVERALGSPDTYAAYKEFFGAASPQIRGVQKAARDKVLQLGNLGKSIDAADFARRLEALDSASPQLLQDAFGANAEMLRKEALVMMKAQGQSLPVEELNQALASGTISAGKLRDMLQAETRRAEAYRNTLVRELSEGILKPEKIKPTQVVDRLVFNRNTQPAELEELMRVAGKSPQVQEDLRRLTFKKALDSATIVDPKTGGDVLSGLELHNMLADPNMVKRLKTVLGEWSYDDLVAIKDFLLPGIRSQEAFRSAGGLVAGSQINQLLGHGDLKAIPQFVKNFVLSVAYTSEPVRRALSNQVLGREGKALAVNLAIASEPFVKALARTFTVDKAKEAQATIKGHLDQMVYRDPQSGQPGPSPQGEGIPWDEFLRRLGEPKPQAVQP